MDGLENLARNLGTYSASADGMLLQKPTVTYGVFLEDDDNLYSNMKAIFSKNREQLNRLLRSPLPLSQLLPRSSQLLPRLSQLLPRSIQLLPRSSQLLDEAHIVRYPKRCEFIEDCLNNFFAPAVRGPCCFQLAAELIAEVLSLSVIYRTLCDARV